MDEQPPTIVLPHRSYTFCFAEEDEETSSSTTNDSPEAVGSGRKQFADVSQQADLDSSAKEELLTFSSQSDDDGLRTAGDSEQSSDAEEQSQISTVTQIESAEMRKKAAPVKFSRSLSLVPCARASTALSLKGLTGRRYASMDASRDCLPPAVTPLLIGDREDQTAEEQPVEDVVAHEEALEQYRETGGSPFFFFFLFFLLMASSCLIVIVILLRIMSRLGMGRFFFFFCWSEKVPFWGF